MTGRARVLVHVQHLKGVGHLRRAAALAGALDRAGMQVTLVSGGMPVAGVDAGAADRVQLPAVRAGDGGYAVLLDARGVPVDDGWRARRRDALLEVFERVRPQVLVIESFPFGRRKLRFELLALLERARAMKAAPIVVSSVRDVPEPRQDAGERVQMVELAERWFDRVLVHGDPGVVRLEDTFPEASRLAARTHYTGYLADARRDQVSCADGAGEVVVSAGGGAAGEALLRTASAAAREDRARVWRILVGPNAPRDLLDAATQASGRIVEPNREDFPALLRNCLVSVSQAGYNTIIDVVRARCCAVVVPHDGGGEREQGIRASLFAARGLVRALAAAELDRGRLLSEVERAAGLPRPPPGGLCVDGARRSAALIGAWIARSP